MIKPQLLHCNKTIPSLCLPDTEAQSTSLF
jgi:hypothetical protein